MIPVKIRVDFIYLQVKKGLLHILFRPFKHVASHTCTWYEGGTLLGNALVVLNNYFLIGLC